MQVLKFFDDRDTGPEKLVDADLMGMRIESYTRTITRKRRGRNYQA